MNSVEPIYKVVISVTDLSTWMLSTTKTIPKELLSIYHKNL